MEIIHLGDRLYSIRVEHSLACRLKQLKESQGLLHSALWSNLFCIQMDDEFASPDDALKRFREIVARAGLGALLEEDHEPRQTERLRGDEEPSDYN